MRKSNTLAHSSMTIHLHLQCHTSCIALSSSPPSTHPSDPTPHINNSRLGGQDSRYAALTLLLAVPQAPPAGRCWQQDHHTSDCDHEPHIYDSHPECNHKHHLNTSPKTNIKPHPNAGAIPNTTVNQMRTPARMRVPPPQSCPWSEPWHRHQKCLPTTRWTDNVHHNSLSVWRWYWVEGMQLGQGGVRIYWRGEVVSLPCSHLPTST